MIYDPTIARPASRGKQSPGEFLQQLDRLWPAEEVDVRAVSLREQVVDGEENLHQLRYHDSDGDPDVTRAWLRTLEKRQALSAVLILKLRLQANAEVSA